MRFKIDWASLIVGMKFTVFALFCFVFEGNFQVQAPPRGGGVGVIFRGAIQRRVFCVASLGGLYLEGLIHGVILRYSGSPRKRTPSGSREKGVHNCSWPLTGM